MFQQKAVWENKMQYYGINDAGNTVYVAMSEKEVINYAKKHPEEGIIRVEDKFKHGYNLKESYIITESLKKWDKKEFEDNSNSYELEMLYESVKDTLSAQQKNDLVKFVRKARTADEINTYMTGMLVKDQTNESLQESSYFEYGNAVSKANQAVDIIDFASDKNDRDIYLGAKVVVPQQLGYADREAQVEDIFINKHGVEMLRVRYNDSKIENVAAKSCTLIESFNEAFDKEPHEFWYYTKHGLGPGTIPKDVNILDVKEDDNWGTYIKLDKVLTTDELNYYELKEKEPLTEDIDEQSFNKLKELAYELDDYIEDKVWVRDFWFDGQFDTTISFEIYGDWKHDHARFDYYASEWLDNKGLKYKMWETITDDDGSDSYGATHTIRLYDIAEESTVEEAYISQSTPQEQPEVEPEKFSNGTLRDFDPYPFIKKIMNSGKSMNSIRTLGDDYYTIFVSYMNHFGPKGIDDKDTKYSLDIIKETPDGEQTRDLFERDLLWNEVAEKLVDWRQDKVTENPLAESIAQLTEGYAYRKVEKAILQAISDIGGECFETIDNDSCSYRFEGKVSRKALITNLSDALKSTGYTILSDNSGVEVQDNDNWWQGTNIEIYNDTDNQEKGYSFFIIGIYDLS